MLLFIHSWTKRCNKGTQWLVCITMASPCYDRTIIDHCKNNNNNDTPLYNTCRWFKINASCCKTMLAMPANVPFWPQILARTLCLSPIFTLRTLPSSTMDSSFMPCLLKQNILYIFCASASQAANMRNSPFTAIVNVAAKEQPDVTSRHLIEAIKIFLLMTKRLILTTLASSLMIRQQIYLPGRYSIRPSLTIHAANH